MRAYLSLAIGVICFLLAGALYSFMYYTLSSWSDKSAALESQADQKAATLDRAARANAELGSLASEETTLNQYTVDKSDVVPFLETLQATGKPLGANVNVNSVSDNPSGGHDRINLSISIEGSFDSVVRTLGAIEYGPYDGMVQSLSLNTTPVSDNASSTGATWTAGVVLSVGTRGASTTPTHP